MYAKVVKSHCKLTSEMKPEDPFYSPVNQAYLKKAVQELEEGKGTIHELIKEDHE